MSNGSVKVNVDFLNREIKPGDLVSHVSSGYTQILFSRVDSFTPKKIRLTRLLPDTENPGLFVKAWEDDSLKVYSIPSQVCLVQTVDGRDIASGFQVIE